MALNQSQQNLLEETVISGGYCVGCGSCVATDESDFVVELDSFDLYQAKAVRRGGARNINMPNAVCPFSSSIAHEDTINKALYKQSDASHDQKIGWHLSTYAV